MVVIDAGAVGAQASGRNGGFCSASVLTHGVANGADRFPDEIRRLQELGWSNLDEIEAAVERHGIACGFQRTGNLTVATAPWLIEPLRRQLGVGARSTVRRSTGSIATPGRADRVADLPRRHLAPTQRGAMVDPARLAWGLAAAVRSLGGTIHEHTPMTGIERHGAGMVVRTPAARLRCRTVVLGTNAFSSLVQRTRLHTVPVYDYVLMTEPLSDAQLASIGWGSRAGVGDMANQFHYYRLTDDHRILWGGYDAIYHLGRQVRPTKDQRPQTFERLATHFFETFPQLEGLRFSHRWGGAIDTCTRFCAFYGSAHDGRVAYALGYTGLGVGASRFGAAVTLDLLDGADNERTRLQMVREKPLPFPPEPFAYAGIQLTRWALARADANEGRRNAWLRTLDRLGLGFDS